MASDALANKGVSQFDEGFRLATKDGVRGLQVLPCYINSLYGADNTLGGLVGRHDMTNDRLSQRHD